MNDDFLRRMRRPPSAAFEQQLRERLREQELGATPRRRPGWKLLAISLLVGGSALATATYLTMSRTPSQSSTPAAQTNRDSASPVPPDEIQNTFLTRGPDAPLDPYAPADTPMPTTRRESPIGAAGNARQPATNSNLSPGGVRETNSYVSSPGLQTSASTRPIRIVASPDIAALAKDTSPGSRYTAGASFEVEAANTALPKLCAEEDADRPDIVVTSRRVRKEELKGCRKGYGNGVLETTLGHVAIVVTRAKVGMPMQLSTRTLRLAVLETVPSPDNSALLIDNPYTHWNQIDPALEDRRIDVLGPARGTPEFLVFAATVLAPGCENNASLDEQTCQGLREDGVYTEVGFDANFVPQRLWSDPNAVAVMDYQFYAANSADLLGSLLPGAAPTRESIADGSYIGSRTLHGYVNRLRYRAPKVRLFVDEYLRLPAYLNRKVMLPAGGQHESWSPYDRGPKLTEVKLD